MGGGEEGKRINNTKQTKKRKNNITAVSGENVETINLILNELQTLKRERQHRCLFAAQSALLFQRVFVFLVSPVSYFSTCCVFSGDGREARGSGVRGG